MAPTGNGFLYINPKRADEVWTTLASSQWDNHEDNGYRLGQRGTGNPSLLIGLETALDFHYEIGPDKVYARIKELGDRLRKGLTELPNVQVLTPPDMAAGLTTFKVTDIEGAQVQQQLWEKGKIQPRALGEGKGTRYSTHIYNNEDEIDRSIDIIRQL